MKKLHQIYCDPAQRLVGDCFLMDANSVAVSDRKGSIAILSCKDHSDFGTKHLAFSCWLRFYFLLALPYLEFRLYPTIRQCDMKAYPNA